MGRLTNQGYADLGLSFRGQLAVHLQNNLYPAIPIAMVTPCELAIAAVLDGNPSEQIELPKGVSWKGKAFASADTVINTFNLQFFLGEDDD
jgi:hypothetical protein